MICRLSIPGESRPGMHTRLPFLAAVGCLTLAALAGISGCRRGGGTGPCGRFPSDFNSIGSALKSYRNCAGFYPTTQQGLAALITRPSTKPLPKRWSQSMDQMPVDPWSRTYRYRALPEGDSRGFELWSAGPDGVDGTKDDLSSLDPVE